MKNKKNILSVIFISIIASAIIEIFKRESSDIFEILGGAIAFILAPYLITCLIKYGFKISLWKWDFEDKRFVRIFFLFWSIWVLLNMMGATPQP